MAEPDYGDDDELLFAEEEPERIPAADEVSLSPWKILIVDDDTEVHAITRVVMGDVLFEGRPMVFLSAHSASEARALLRAHDDVAAILLDVVMETDDAGLKLVRFIREELGDHQVRIILRTGQPGQAPERQVIVDYDINDYKAKSELTAQKLFTATVAALRSYQHISAIEHGRRGLERIVDASLTLFERRTRDAFLDGVMSHVAALFQDARGTLLCTAGPDGSGAPRAVTGSGVFAGLDGRPLADALDAGALDPDALDAVARAFADHGGRHGPDWSVLLFQARSGAPGALYVEGHRPLDETDRRLIALFCTTVAIGFDNVHLYERLQEAQRATVHALGKLAEYKDEVTGDHVRRIGRWATLVARELQTRGSFPDTADEQFCDQIGLASMLHDVGKVGIPDSILRKPGTLDPDELRVMREHAGMGARILREAADMVGGRNYLSLGAEIAESHHEKFDGTGYPQGLKGDAIPLSGRIVAVADVYDALLHRRPYKHAWDRGAVLDLIRREAGRHFDPRVVDAFLAVIVTEEAPAAL